MVTVEQQQKLEEIIVNQWITPVYQPIVSLQDGSVLGFEALSRVEKPGIFDNIEEMFQCAEESGCIWMLEQVCRRAILRGVYDQKNVLDQYHAKIFINVSPKVLHDEKFRQGFTREYTKRYGIDTERIVFEVTERERVEDENSFRQAIGHYKMQNYQIAIDDVGSGYAGLNRICSLSPGYIKLDNELVHDVYKNPIKYAMIKGMVEFSHSSGTLLIAEGIETKKELELLIDLGVQYGQGYYLASPERMLRFDNPQAVSEILEKNTCNHMHNHLGVKKYYIKNLMKTGLTVEKNATVESVLSYMKHHEEAVGICVVEQGRVSGILTREKLFQKLSGQYGFSLYHKKNIGDLAEKNFLMVDAHTSISSVAKIAMEREMDALYDFIVVREDDKYAGIVTIQDLLKKAMEIDVDLAKCANPLTGLPGNIVIDQEVKESVESGKQCTIYYFDLDNFKAFNDVYGFEKGDEVIRILADVLKKNAGGNDFVGHIGGDDFVMICEGYQSLAFSEKIRKEFEAKAHMLYKEEDRIRRCIRTCNRHGILETFPLVSVTIVSASNEQEAFGDYEEVVGMLAGYKKTAKTRKRELATG
ncbi:MAG: GGDEF domain-containing protein [Lachnospiraceae bacterium]|nr:GGDEF domain-containing protein [Lachnospiraceae bacterium]